MINRFKIICISFGLVLLFLIIFVWHSISAKIALRNYGSTHLVLFVHKIADSDRIVGTFRDSKVSVIITGADVMKVVQAVASASSHSPPGQYLYNTKAIFYKGTNELGYIEICEGMFLVDDCNDPSFQDETGLLKNLIIIPAYESRQ